MRKIELLLAMNKQRAGKHIRGCLLRYMNHYHIKIVTDYLALPNMQEKKSANNMLYGLKNKCQNQEACENDVKSLDSMKSPKSSPRLG